MSSQTFVKTIVSGELIQKYNELIQKINNLYNIIGYTCKNGKRLILRKEGSKKCLSMNKNLQLVEFAAHDEFFENASELILGYFEEISEVSVSEIYIFKDKQEAVTWLLSEEAS